ncbi:Zinc finger, C6HC-type [Lasallia pustulata]|uniref:Zinc finger, C6HC-type n=1 Tax=Lasallia pustulata TaxID=136370 RepID=A0A1W5CRC7_9LECA|nr:Zinc finger, C6HC-type [Lasallia pustulata]
MDGCVISEDEAQLWKAVEENKWRRCKCGRVIERDDGCNHMTCALCGAEWCYGCGYSWSRSGWQRHGPLCPSTNRGPNPEFNNEQDDHGGMGELLDPGIDDGEHSIAGEAQDVDGNEETGGLSDENTPQPDPETGQETDLAQAPGEHSHEVVNPYRGPTPEQRNCLHRDAHFHRFVFPLCQLCQKHADTGIFRCGECNLSTCEACARSRRILTLRDDVPPEDVGLPWGGDQEAELLAGDGSAGSSIDPFGLDLTEGDAQGRAADAGDRVWEAREHVAVVREQFREAQKRLVLAEERLEWCRCVIKLLCAFWLVSEIRCWLSSSF